MTQTNDEFAAALHSYIVHWPLRVIQEDESAILNVLTESRDRLEAAGKRIVELEVENAGCASLLQTCFDATGRDVTNGGAEVLPAVIAELHDRCDAMRQARDILDVATDEEVLAFIRRVLSCRAGH